MKLSVLILLGFGVIILTSIFDSVANYVLSLKVKRNTEFLARSETTIRNSNKLHNAIVEMQAAFRGYLLTDDTGFIAIYDKSIDLIEPLMREQAKLIKEDHSQYLLLDSIHALHKQWIAYADSLLESKKRLSASPESIAHYNYLFENKLKKQVGKKLNDEITAKFLVFDKHEYESRNERSRNLIESIEQTHTISAILLGLTIVLGVSSAIYIVVVITKRIASMVSMAEGISNGKFSVVTDNQNDELTGLSRSLNVMSDKLSKNIRELENRNAELSKFAYVVSHDLKAPIRGIYNVIQWIKEDLGGEISTEMNKYLDIIPQRTKRMEDLINGLLDYARINEKTKLENIQTAAMVKEITDAIVPREFHIEIKDMPMVYSERLKLEQVFTNLISNSVKYTPVVNGRIIISSIVTGDYYEFSVKDNGIGIAQEYHEKIFEMFQTLREKHEKESTGIGLAIVKKIIEEQHCTIRVNSEPGKGAEFLFTWPKYRQ